jgi:hypothetical protein
MAHELERPAPRAGRRQPTPLETQQDSRISGEEGNLPAIAAQARDDATSIRPGYRHLQRIYCTWRDDELVALRLEAMTLPELVQVSGKVLARGRREKAVELLMWINRCALSRPGVS